MKMTARFHGHRLGRGVPAVPLLTSGHDLFDRASVAVHAAPHGLITRCGTFNAGLAAKVPH